uniref:CUB domain-containing protein n=1 Tax=Stomoxys calcitrans TaxID=35570 RepID=A0A1I8P2I7_STOCA
MKFLLYHLASIWWISLAWGHTHDEIPKCALTGVYKTRQTILESPNYPDNYPAGTCWDYVIRSPFRCPTKFHVQFLDFYLEASKDCQNDYLAVGLENVDDDMDTLCGQVVGIKKYHTPDGILRLRFYADESPWSTGKGFKLLITRLACEKEEVQRQLDDNEDDDDTVTVTAPINHLRPPQTQIMDLFRNFTGQEQHQVYPLPPVFAINYATPLPSPPYPAIGGYYLPSAPAVQQQNYLANTQNTLEKPCTTNNEQKQLQQQQQQQPQLLYPTQPSYVVGSSNNYLPISRDQYVGSWPTSSYLRAIDGNGRALDECCTSAFQQKRFYLSSPGFPRTIFSNLLPVNRRDCEFRIQKHSGNVCRLRVEFKFFDFGQSYHGTGSVEGNIGLPAIASSRNTCTDDYIEIDNQRFCGCHSDNVYTGFWNYQGHKKIRMRMGYSGIPSSGFLLELIQEECSETQFSTSTLRPTRPIAPTPTLPIENGHNYLDQQLQHGGGHYTGGLTQQQFGGLAQNIEGQNPFPLQPNYQGQPVLQPFINPGIPQNPLFGQPQISLPSNGGLYQPVPAQLGGGYQYTSPNPLQVNPFGLPQIRYARSFGDQQQPVTIVETNSTRKEYYFNDNGDTTTSGPYASALRAEPQLSIAMSRSSKAEGATRWEAEDLRANKNRAQVRRKCSFDMGDILRLSVDVLWITKPTCYAPQRNWFSNLLG